MSEPVDSDLFALEMWSFELLLETNYNLFKLKFFFQDFLNKLHELIVDILHSLILLDVDVENDDLERSRENVFGQVTVLRDFCEIIKLWAFAFVFLFFIFFIHLFFYFWL